jgi:hypothetical protein
MSRAERSWRRKEKWQEIIESWQEFKEEWRRNQAERLEKARRDQAEWEKKESWRRQEEARRCKRCGGMGQYFFPYREGGGGTWTECRH